MSGALTERLCSGLQIRLVRFDPERASNFSQDLFYFLATLKREKTGKKRCLNEVNNCPSPLLPAY